MAASIHELPVAEVVTGQAIEAARGMQVDLFAKLTLAVGVAGVVCSPVSCFILGPIALVLGSISGRRLSKDPLLGGRKLRDCGILAALAGMLLNVLLIVNGPTTSPTTSTSDSHLNAPVPSQTKGTSRPTPVARPVKATPPTMSRPASFGRAKDLRFLASCTAYSHALSENCSAISACKGRLAPLLEHADITNAEWKSNVLTLVGELDVHCQDGQRLQAPTGFRKSKALYDLALIEYRQVCLKLPRAIDTADVTLMLECTSHIAAANDYIQQATDQQDAVTAALHASSLSPQ